MNDCGITYVAWGRGVAQAARSAATAQSFGYSTCLITTDRAPSAFHHIIKVEGPLRSPSDKVAYYQLSPYPVTLFLDTDTFVMDSLDFGFQQARLHGLSLALAPACFVGPHWGLDVDPNLQQYNAGVIFHNREHPSYRNLWDEVEAVLRREWVTGQTPPPINDQSALSLHLHRMGLNPYVLAPNWNLRPQFGMRTGFGGIKIWHCGEPPPAGLATEGFWRVGNPYHRPQVVLRRLLTRLKRRLFQSSKYFSSSVP